MQSNRLQPLVSKHVIHVLLVILAFQLLYKVHAVWNGNLQFKADGTFKMVMFTDLHMAENTTTGAWDEAKDKQTMQASKGCGCLLVTSTTGSSRESG